MNNNTPECRRCGGGLTTWPCECAWYDRPWFATSLMVIAFLLIVGVVVLVLVAS